ncbi:hypothetical protein C4D60_Mb02t01750 [Musa balbisiana]|uniref:Uncharacterized protein n=1 Tax=Musa balbisiana TaxID=52838 RepID=A0A4S8I9W4_MUSBA|nr:hypothetical protein C4D60_Mb02t01750 [Musa balbisiana]
MEREMLPDLVEGNSRGLGDLSWLSRTGMMSPAPVPWALYPTLSCLAAKFFCRAFRSPWKPEDAITHLSALHNNRTDKTSNSFSA